ncbi:MAG TPA: alpha/beta hydrolase [Sphingobacteriaceae bacterium]|nr:alpha/beta hydrolase [Sphingobacteriaceae bacterium]
MKKTLFLNAFLFIALSCFSQTEVIKLWPGEVPGEAEPKHEPVLYVAKNTGNNIRRITNITDPQLTLYKPTKNANGAAIIISPGGGNKYLAINIEGHEVAAYFAARGYTAFVLEYRVPLNPQGAFQDIQRAVRIMRSRAGQWNLKINKIGVMGFSAGGILSARITTGFKNSSYPAIDKADSLSARPDFALLIYPGSLSTSDKTLIPELKPTEETPPVFIFSTGDDPINIPFTLGIALRELKLPFEFHVVPEGGHGYGLRKGNPAAEAWSSLATHWLRKNILHLE